MSRHMHRSSTTWTHTGQHKDHSHTHSSYFILHLHANEPLLHRARSRLPGIQRQSPCLVFVYPWSQTPLRSRRIHATLRATTCLVLRGSPQQIIWRPK